MTKDEARDAWFGYTHAPKEQPELLSDALRGRSMLIEDDGEWFQQDDADVMIEAAARIEALESALVHVAFGMHREPGNRLIEGVTLGDTYHVTVKMPDGSKVEAVCKESLKHWRDNTRPERASFAVWGGSPYCGRRRPHGIGGALRGREPYDES